MTVLDKEEADEARSYFESALVSLAPKRRARDKLQFDVRLRNFSEVTQRVSTPLPALRDALSPPASTPAKGGEACLASKRRII